MIKLVAIDLDGTLFNNHSEITEENKKAIFYLKEHGVYPVISTGRPFNGIPETLKKELPFAYAITANGSGVYEIASGKCIYSDCMDASIALPILKYLATKDMHLDAFIDGVGTTTYHYHEQGMRLPLPEELKKYVIGSRECVDSIEDLVEKEGKGIQKITLNFFSDGKGGYVDREEIKAYLEANPNVDPVCGGYHNLEFTKAGVNKGVGIRKLAEYLGLEISETMAIGDTENDLSIIEAAGTGVAMGNAIPMIKEAADYVTDTNDNSGVAKAIYHFCPADGY